MPSTDSLAPTTIDLGHCVVHLERALVRWPNREISLTRREQALLRYLAARPGKPVSAEELLLAVWEYKPGVRSRAVTAAVARLRAKIEREPEAQEVLTNTYGVGYALHLPVAPPVRVLEGRESVDAVLSLPYHMDGPDLLANLEAAATHGPGAQEAARQLEPDEAAQVLIRLFGVAPESGWTVDVDFARDLFPQVKGSTRALLMSNLVQRTAQTGGVDAALVEAEAFLETLTADQIRSGHIAFSASYISVLWAAGREDAAIAFADRALEWAARVHAPFATACIKERLARRLGLGGASRRVDHLYRDALATFRRERCVHAAIRTEYNWANYRWQHGWNAEEPEQVARHAAARWEEMGDLAAARRATCWIGDLLVQQGAYEEALDTIAPTLAYFDNTDVKLHRIAVGPTVAKANIGLGRLVAAREELEWLLYLSEASGDVTVVPDVQLLLGWVLAQLGDVAEGQRLLRAAAVERVRLRWTRPAATLLLAGLYPEGHRAAVRLRTSGFEELERLGLPVDVWSGREASPTAPWAFEVWLLQHNRGAAAPIPRPPGGGRRR